MDGDPAETAVTSNHYWLFHTGRQKSGPEICVAHNLEGIY